MSSGEPDLNAATPSPDRAPSWDPVAVAERVAPLVRDRAEDAEAQRRLPAELVTALTDAGLFRLFVPRAYGGPAVDPLVGLRAIETVARADGAAGWCVNIASTTATMSWYLDPRWAAEIYGDPGVVTGGAFAPTGRARRTEGGWIIEAGRWAWGSGTQHCQWINCGVLTDEGGFHLMYVPAAEVEFFDTWYSSGLRGTGSLDFEVRDRFVPEGRELRPGRTSAKVDEPLCHFPNFSLLAAGLCSVTLGIGARAVDELAALATERTPMLAAKSLAHQGYVQVDLARASAAIGSARAYVTDQVGRVWDRVQAGTRVGVDQRAELRLACHHAAFEAARAVDLAYTAAGGAAVYASSPLQRCLRDIHVATQHVMLSPRTLEMFAKVRLGLEVDTTLM
jgi:alkylation response protein AidB-like acyl-CoA dehydrogenase